jgi:hypothetical protein
MTDARFLELGGMTLERRFGGVDIIPKWGGPGIHLEQADIVDIVAFLTPAPSDELQEALARLRWVVPGRHYGNRMIEDVQTVLQHFGMTNAHGGTHD